MKQRSREALRAGLEAMYGHDLATARNELEWVESNLEADTSMPALAVELRALVARLEKPESPYKV